MGLKTTNELIEDGVISKRNLYSLLKSIPIIKDELEREKVVAQLKELKILNKSKNSHTVVDFENKNMFPDNLRVASKKYAQMIAGTYGLNLKSEDIAKDKEELAKIYGITLNREEAEECKPRQWGSINDSSKGTSKEDKEKKDYKDLNGLYSIFEEFMGKYEREMHDLKEKIGGLENLVRNQSGMVIENSTIYGDVYNIHGNNNTINGNRSGQGRNNQPGNPNGGGGGNNGGNGGGGNNNNNNTGPTGGPGNPGGQGNPTGQGPANRTIFDEIHEELERERMLGAAGDDTSKEGQQNGKGYETPGYLLNREADPEKADRYLARQEQLLRQNKPLVTLYVEKAFVASKWGFILPGAKAAKENMKISGRPGWKPKKFLDKIKNPLLRFCLSWVPSPLFGQPDEYDGVDEDTRMRYYVYMIDHREENPEKKLLYKIADRKRQPEEVRDPTKNFGKPYLYELLGYGRSQGGRHVWNTINAMAENLAYENELSENKYGEKFDKGMVVLDTALNGKDTNIKEDTKTLLRKMVNWGREYKLTTKSIRGIADECVIDKELIASWLTGTEFSVTNKAGFGRKTYATIKKKRATSWARSLAGLALYNYQNKETRDDNVTDWKKESYEINIFNPVFAGSTITRNDNGKLVVANEDWNNGAIINERQFDSLAGALALAVPYFDREYEWHKFRFDDIKKNAYHSSKYNTSAWEILGKYGISTT